MEERAALDILTFTLLQESIDWDEKSQEFYLNYEFSAIEIDNKAKQLGEAELRLLKEHAEPDKEEEHVEKSLKAFLKLEEIARRCNVYKAGIFGASFINAVHNSLDLEGYGKSEGHLQLGSLNVPTENLGLDSVPSPRQYFYFDRARSVIEEPSAGAAPKVNKRGMVNSEVFQILEAKEVKSKGSTFLNPYEAKSSCLFVRYEYILLYLLRNYNSLVYRRQKQLEKLESDIRDHCDNSNVTIMNLLEAIEAAAASTEPLDSSQKDTLETLITQAIAPLKEKFGNKAGAMQEELAELILMDPIRFSWLESLKNGTAAAIREKITAALEDDNRKGPDPEFHRAWIAKVLELVKNAGDIDLDKLSKVLPALDIPHQAYLRLLAPRDGKTLELVHMVIPVNHQVIRGKTDPRGRYIKQTMFMLVSAHPDWLLVLFGDDEDAIFHRVTCLLGLFMVSALELLTIPDAIRLNDTTRRHSIQSAMTAIMSRNGSHNLGSHVINRVVESLDSLNIQDHKYLLRYIQQRMDFLAQLSTEFSSWTSAHWFANEIMKFFYEQHHLLDFIARAEGIRAFDNYHDTGATVTDPEGDGEQKLAELITMVMRKPKDASGNILAPIGLVIPGKDGESRLEDDVSVAIPGGLVGFHAIYTILENFIRNAAKHGYATQSAAQKTEIKPKIFIKLCDHCSTDENLFPVLIWDNFSHISHPADCEDIIKDGLMHEWFEGNDFSLAHYNDVWPDDVPPDKQLDFCSRLIDPLIHQQYPELINKLKQTIPVSFWEIIENVTLPSTTQTAREEQQEDIKRLFSRIIKLLNSVLRTFSPSLEGRRNFIGTDNQELKFLAGQEKLPPYLCTRLNRLILEQLMPEDVLTRAPRILVESQSPKPAWWQSELLDFAESPDCPDHGESRRLTFRIAPKYFTPQANVGIRSLRYVDRASWDTLLTGASGGELPMEKVLSFLERYYAPIHWNINRFIMKSLIDDEGRLRPENWGIAEMKICAGYLKQTRLEQIGAEGRENFSILKAVAHKYQEDDKLDQESFRLAYAFNLLRPQEVAFSSKEGFPDEKIKTVLKNHGILFHSHQTFQAPFQPSTPETAVTLPSAEFIILLTGDDEKNDNINPLINLLAQIADTDEDTQRLTLIADLKIAIEQYPMRIFLAYCTEIWENRVEKLQSINFIKKRICFIDHESINLIINAAKAIEDAELAKEQALALIPAVASFKLLLYGEWLRHMKTRLRGIEKPLILRLNTLKGGAVPPNNIEEEVAQFSKKVIDSMTIPDDKKKNHCNFLVKEILGLLNKKGFGDSTYHPPTLPTIYEGAAGGQKDGGSEAEKTYNEKKIATPKVPDVFFAYWNTEVTEEETDDRIIYYNRHDKAPAGKTYCYYEALTGASSHFPVLSHCRFDMLEKLSCQLVENGLWRIAIADERVLDSKFIEKEYLEYEAANIFFISNFCGVEIQTTIPGALTLNSDGKCKRGEAYINPDILIVHQGILDKGKDKGVFGIPTTRLIADIKENIPWVIVTSGRGQPPSLPRGAKFIPFSHIEATLLGASHSKFTLSRLLGNLREKGGAR